MSGYEDALQYRDVFKQICKGMIDQLRPKPSYATCMSVDLVGNTIMALYNGDTQAVSVRLGSVLPQVGSTVRIEGSANDRYVADVVGQSMTTFLLNKEHVRNGMSSTLSGGSIRRTLNDLYISWASEILISGTGLGGPDQYSSGYGRILMPPGGTVIQGYGGCPSETVPTTIPYLGMIPLQGYTTLWYDPPVGGGPASAPGNFKLTGILNNISFQVPHTWIPIATRNSNNGPLSSVKWFDGRTTTDWKSASLQGTWANFGSPFAPAQYRIDNGKVYLRGLVRNGALNSTILLIPAGMRPEFNMLFHGTGSASVEPPNANSNYEKYLRLNMQADGILNFGGVDATYVSLDGICWDPAQ